MHETGVTGAHFGGSYFTGSVEDGIEIAYSYLETEPVTESLEVGYSYTDLDDIGITGLVHGSISPYSQKIANNLPMWMEARKNRDSLFQKLTTSWGYNIDRIQSSYQEHRKNMFLSSANVYEDIWFGYSGLAFKGRRVYQPRMVNFLYNSSFAILGPKRYRKPDGWTVERDTLDSLILSEDNAIFGSRSLFFDGAKGTALIKQLSGSRLNSGTLLFSIYVMATTDMGTKFHDADDAGITLTVRYIDEEVESFGAGFPKGCDGNWARVFTKIKLKKEIANWQVIIKNRTVGGFYIDLPQLENDSSPTSWSPSMLDIPPHFSGERTLGAVQVLFKGSSTHSLGNSIKKIEILPATTEQDFRFPKVPTRIDKISPKDYEKNAINLKYSNRIDYFKENLALMWDVTDSKLRQKSITTFDTYGSHLPADLITVKGLGKVLDLSSANAGDIAVKAVTIVGDLFYVVTKETYDGESGYYLKIVEPRKKSEDDTYMPSIGDLELPLELGSSLFGQDGVDEDIIRIGIAKNLTDVIFLDTDLDRRFYFKLRYDYYYADFGKRKLFCRENYTKKMGHLQVI